MTHAIDTIITFITALFGLVLTGVADVDGTLAVLMTSAGLPENMQSAVLLVVAILLIIFAIRVLGGIFGMLLIILAIMLIMHRMAPGIQGPHGF